MASAPSRHLEPDVAELVPIALTRFLAKARQLRGSNVHIFSRFLSGYGHTPVKRGGRLEPPPCPEVPTSGFPSGSTVYHRLGIDHDYLEELFDAAALIDEASVSYERDLLTHFVAEELWPAAAQVIRDGPAVAGMRLQRLVWRWCQETVNPNRRRPSGGQISRRTVAARIQTARAFFLRLTELQVLGNPARALSSWTHVPPKPTIPAEDVHTAQAAPPRAHLRRAWRHHDALVRRYLGCDRSEDELEAIASLSDAKVEKTGWRLMKHRAFLFSFAVIGMRLDAAIRLAICDYETERLCADGARHAAIAIEPRKGKKVRRYKPIPHGAEYVYESYIAFSGRRLANRGLELDPDWPLFFATPSAPERRSWHANISRTFGGGDTGDGWVAPLIPFDPDLIEMDRREMARHKPFGYTPHALRRAAFQLVRYGAREYAKNHELELEPESIAEALLDHKVPRDRLGYGDVSQEEGRERWSAVGAELGWRVLTTDFGARRARDETALLTALRRRDSLAVELERARSAIERTSAQAGLSERHAQTDKERIEELLAIARQRNRLEATYRLESRLRDELAETELEIERIRHDPARRILLDDDESGAGGSFLEDLDALSGTLAAHVSPLRIRDWLTLNELSDVSGYSPAAVRRWVTGEALPRRPGHPHNPWELECIPVDESHGPMRRRIAVAGIKPSFLAYTGASTRLDEVLSRWPKGWSLETCEAPLSLAGRAAH